MWLFLVVTAFVFLPAVVLAVIAVRAGTDRDPYTRASGLSFAALVCAVIALALTAFFGWLSFGTEDTVTFKVEGKERIAEGNDGKWLIYATDGTTYENTDAWFHGKTNSTDLFRDIVVGHTLRCDINGVRWPLLSSYKNLLDCTDVTTGKKLR